MMDQNIKKEWVSALRSGQYTQTHQVLHDSSGFCCLGVLQDLHLKSQNGRWLDFNGSYFRATVGNVESGGYLYPTQSCVTWAGLPSENPEISVTQNIIGKLPEERRESDVKLGDLNDNFQLTFEEIASLIEADQEL